MLDKETDIDRARSRLTRDAKYARPAIGLGMGRLRHRKDHDKEADTCISSV